MTPLHKKNHTFSCFFTAPLSDCVRYSLVWERSTRCSVGQHDDTKMTKQDDNLTKLQLISLTVMQTNWCRGKKTETVGDGHKLSKLFCSNLILCGLFQIGNKQIENLK